MARDEKILDAAQRLFHERGFSAVGVDEIGERAGITGPAIYRHFSGKDEVLSTLFDRAVDALVTGLRDDFDDAHDELRYLAQAHAEFVLAEQELAAIMIRDERSLAEPYKRRHTRRERPYIERWIACIERCLPNLTGDEATTATFAVLHMLNSVGTWPAGARQAAELATLTAEMALGAVHALRDAGSVAA